MKFYTINSVNDVSLLLCLRNLPPGGNAYVVQMQPVDINQPISFGKDPVRTKCQNCFAEIFTRVDNRITSGGKFWAIFCCCFGSWLLSLMVFCVEGFREFIHLCPSCNRYIATYKPKFSGGAIVGLVFMSFLVVALQILFVLFYILPHFGRNYYDEY